MANETYMEISEMLIERITHILIHTLQDLDTLGRLPEGLAGHALEVRSDELYVICVMARRLGIRDRIYEFLNGIDPNYGECLKDQFDSIDEFEKNEVMTSVDDKNRTFCH